MAELQERATAWLVTFCPRAITRLTAAHDALLRGDEASMSHAVSSCRRALTALTDVVDPPAPGTRLDHTGQERKVGRDEYKNRLRLHLGKRITSKSGRRMSIRELEALPVEPKVRPRTASSESRSAPSSAASNSSSPRSSYPII